MAISDLLIYDLHPQYPSGYRVSFTWHSGGTASSVTLYYGPSAATGGDLGSLPTDWLSSSECTSCGNVAFNLPEDFCPGTLYAFLDVTGGIYDGVSNTTSEVLGACSMTFSTSTDTINLPVFVPISGPTSTVTFAVTGNSSPTVEWRLCYSNSTGTYDWSEGTVSLLSYYGDDLGIFLTGYEGETDTVTVNVSYQAYVDLRFPDYSYDGDKASDCIYALMAKSTGYSDEIAVVTFCLSTVTPTGTYSVGLTAPMFTTESGATFITAPCESKNAGARTNDNFTICWGVDPWYVLMSDSIVTQYTCTGPTISTWIADGSEDMSSTTWHGFVDAQSIQQWSCPKIGADIRYSFFVFTYPPFTDTETIMVVMVRDICNCYGCKGFWSTGKGVGGKSIKRV